MADSSGLYGTHHITLTKSGGSAVGYMLAKEKGIPQFQMFGADVLQPSIPEGKISEANIVPGVDLPLGQDSFVGGFGEYTAKSGRRYYDSNGIDASNAGYLEVAGNYGNVSDYIVPTITNGEFETDTAGWVTASGTWARSNTKANEGTWSVRCTATGVFTYSFSWSTAYRSKKITVSMAVHTETDNATFQIYDGVDTTNANATVSSAGDVFIGLSATHTLNANATELTIKLIGTTGGGAIYFDSIMVCAPVCFEQFNGNLYMARGGVLQKLNTSTGIFDDAARFPHAISSLCSFQNVLYVCLWGSSITAYTNYDYWYSSDGSSFTENILANGTMRHMGACGNKLVGAITAETIRTTTNGTGAAWSSAITIGASSEAILRILDHPEGIYVRKTDGLWYVDSAGYVSLYTPELKSDISSSSNCITYWKGQILVSSGTQNCWRITPSGIMENISPWTYAKDNTTYQKYVKAMAGDVDWLYAVLHTSTLAVLMKGGDVSGLGWVWYPLWQWTHSDIKDAIVDSSYQRAKLYVATNTGVVWFETLPGHQACTTNPSVADLYTPWMDANLPTRQKAYHSLTLQTYGIFDDGLGVYSRIAVAYRTTDDGSWTTWATAGTQFTADSTTGIIRLYAPSAITAPKIQFRFTFSQSASEPSDSKLFGYSVTSRLRDTPRKRFKFTVCLAERQVLLNEQAVQQDTPTALTTLLTYGNETWPLTLTDPVGTTYYIDIERMGYRWATAEKNIDPELWVTIEAVEAKLS